MSFLSFHKFLKSQGYDLGTIKNGLVLYLSFDSKDINGLTVRDKSPKGNNGTVNGASQVNALIDKGFLLDGIDDYIDVIDDPSLNLDKFSVSIWFKTSTQATQDIINKNGTILETAGNNITYAIWLFHSLTQDQIRCGFEDNAGANYFIKYDFNYYDNQWHNVVVTYDMVNLKLYVDGNFISLLSTSASTDKGNKPLRIGANADYPNTSGRFFNGIVDEAMVWNRALSEIEVKELHYIQSQPLG